MNKLLLVAALLVSTTVNAGYRSPVDKDTYLEISKESVKGKTVTFLRKVTYTNPMGQEVISQYWEQVNCANSTLRTGTIIPSGWTLEKQAKVKLNPKDWDENWEKINQPTHVAAANYVCGALESGDLK